MPHPTNDATPTTRATAADGFLIWTKTGRNPKRWHGHRDGAEAEASRLATKRPGQAFFVLEMTTKHKAAPVAVVAEDMAEAA